MTVFNLVGFGIHLNLKWESGFPGYTRTRNGGTECRGRKDHLGDFRITRSGEAIRGQEHGTWLSIRMESNCIRA